MPTFSSTHIYDGQSQLVTTPLRRLEDDEKHRAALHVCHLAGCPDEAIVPLMALGLIPDPDIK